MKRSDIARLASQVIAQFEADSKLQCFDCPGGATRMLEGIADTVFSLEIKEDPTLQAPALGELNPSLGTISVRPGLEPGVRPSQSPTKSGMRNVIPARFFRTPMTLSMMRLGSLKAMTESFKATTSRVGESLRRTHLPPSCSRRLPRFESS